MTGNNVKQFDGFGSFFQAENKTETPTYQRCRILIELIPTSPGLCDNSFMNKSLFFGYCAQSLPTKHHTDLHLPQIN